MASELADAQITAKQRLQRAAAAAVAAAWSGLRHYNVQQVDQFLTSVLPFLAAANEQTVMLTEAFLARSIGRTPVGLDAGAILAGIRNGATPEEVYRRPFVTVWGALGRGVPWEQAVQIGGQRAASAAVTDVQLAFTHTLQAAGDTPELVGEDRPLAYQRVPDDGACEFCVAAADQIYHSSDLMPLHNLCGCGVEVLQDPSSFHAPQRFATDAGVEVAVRDHGELGPVLTNAADHFTGRDALAAH